MLFKGPRSVERMAAFFTVDSDSTRNERLYIHFSHFSVEDFIPSKTQKGDFEVRRMAQPTIEYSCVFATKRDLIAHLNAALPQSGTSLMFLKNDSRMCIFFLGSDCQEIKTEVGYHRLPNKTKAKKKWIKILCPGIKDCELQILLLSNQRAG